MTNVLIRNNRKEMHQLLVDETIFSQANGVFGVRGSFCEGYGDAGEQSYALINGFYNTYDFYYEENSIHFPQVGQTIVKLPDATRVKFQFDGEAIDLSHCELVDLKREYRLDQGLTYRRATYKNTKGEMFVIEEERIVSQLIKGLLSSHITFQSLNTSGELSLESGIYMPVVKEQDHTDPRVAQEKVHLEHLSSKRQDNAMSLSVKTTRTNLYLTVTLTTSEKMQGVKSNSSLTSSCTKAIKQDEKYELYQHAYYDSELTNPRQLAVLDVFRDYDYDSVKRAQQEWATSFWGDGQLEISDDQINTALKYAVYQLNSSGGESDQIQIAAKGISGVGYEGHYFWDTEIYMLPYFILNHPEKAKNILMYRYHHLESSRQEARHLGVDRGVKIPWRTINGLETSPYYPAGSAQIHINSDIAYAIRMYFNATLDVDFMRTAGFELLIETAVFLLDYGHFENGNFHLNTVTGPDEYTALVNDNYYTNAMAKYHFDTILDLYEKYPREIDALMNRLGYPLSIFKEFKQASSEMVFLQKDRVIAQDEGFFNKKYLSMEAIPHDRHPMLLHYHPLYIYRHQVLKQADVMLALVMLNHEIDHTYRTTFDYYNKRTTHDSSLSKCIYGISSFALGELETAFRYFEDSLFIDLNDERNHSQHGLHMANIGGAYLLLIYGLFGVRIGEQLNLAPIVQNKFNKVKIEFKYQGVKLNLELSYSALNIAVDKPIRLKVYGKEMLIEHSEVILIKNS